MEHRARVRRDPAEHVRGLRGRCTPLRSRRGVQSRRPQGDAGDPRRDGGLRGERRRRPSRLEEDRERRRELEEGRRVVERADEAGLVGDPQEQEMRPEEGRALRRRPAGARVQEDRTRRQDAHRERDRSRPRGSGPRHRLAVAAGELDRARDVGREVRERLPGEPPAREEERGEHGEERARDPLPRWVPGCAPGCPPGDRGRGQHGNGGGDRVAELDQREPGEDRRGDRDRREPPLPLAREPDERGGDRQEGVRVGVERLEDQRQEVQPAQDAAPDPFPGHRQDHGREELEGSLPQDHLGPEELGHVGAGREEAQRAEREHVVDAGVHAALERPREGEAPRAVEQAVGDVAGQDRARGPDEQDEGDPDPGARPRRSRARARRRHGFRTRTRNCPPRKRQASGTAR